MIRLGFEHEVIKEEESNLDVVTKTEHEQAVERDGDMRLHIFLLIVFDRVMTTSRLASNSSSLV